MLPPPEEKESARDARGFDMHFFFQDLHLPRGSEKNIHTTSNMMQVHATSFFSPAHPDEVLPENTRKGRTVMSAMSRKVFVHDKYYRVYGLRWKKKIKNAKKKRTNYYRGINCITSWYLYQSQSCRKWVRPSKVNIQSLVSTIPDRQTPGQERENRNKLSFQQSLKKREEVDFTPEGRASRGANSSSKRLW